MENVGYFIRMRGVQQPSVIDHQILRAYNGLIFTFERKGSFMADLLDRIKSDKSFARDLQEAAENLRKTRNPADARDLLEKVAESPEQLEKLTSGMTEEEEVQASITITTITTLTTATTAF